MFVNLPTEGGREDILRALTKNGTKPRMSADVDLAYIARHPSAGQFSGADMSALVTEASVMAFKEHLSQWVSPCNLANFFAQDLVKVFFLMTIHPDSTKDPLS